MPLLVSLLISIIFRNFFFCLKKKSGPLMLIFGEIVTWLECLIQDDHAYNMIAGSESGEYWVPDSHSKENQN